MQSLIERTWKHVAKDSDKNACWFWTGQRNGDGYGLIRLDPRRFVDGQPNQHRSRCRIAHRVIYESEIGPIPDGMVILHRCDNPACCNPRHLRVGTQKENVLDSVAKGRWRKPGWTFPNQHKFKPLCGSENHMAKLNDDLVREIRRSVRAKERTQKSWAQELGVHENLIQQVYVRKLWKHVT